MLSQGSSVSGSVSLVGWRVSEQVGSLSQSLETVDTSIISSSECGVTSDTVLCSGDNVRCQGDVGAPLVKNSVTLVGVMAGHDCCSQSQYGQFAAVASECPPPLHLMILTMNCCRIHKLDPDSDISEWWRGCLYSVDDPVKFNAIHSILYWNADYNRPDH